jgi:hypothetical protein
MSNLRSTTIVRSGCSGFDDLKSQTSPSLSPGILSPGVHDLSPRAPSGSDGPESLRSPTLRLFSSSTLRASAISVLKLKLQCNFPRSSRSGDKCPLADRRLSTLQGFGCFNITPPPPSGSPDPLTHIPSGSNSPDPFPWPFGSPRFGNLKFQTLRDSLSCACEH